MGRQIREIEVLAPARNYEVACAAVDCGADAVYIGGSSFGARKDARNATDDIRRTVEYAHRFGVRVYATLNTVVFEHELEQARALAQEIVAAGVDALIVQDPCYLRMGLEGVEFHASTQMFNASVEQVRFLSECGFTRVVLERNLSLREIREMGRECDVELECFVHGAVCVCYSGRCAMSLSVGGGSGNRGACSQPCRLPYDLVDDAGRVLVRGKHLLSVRDLDLSRRVGEMIDAGVTSFKIEGRLKDINYVRNVTAAYRRAVDEALRVREGYVRSSVGESRIDFTPDLAKSFTRSGSVYFFDGLRQGVASFDTPKSVGEQMGRVKNVGRDWFELDRGEGDMAAGDGICFVTDGRLCGTNVNRVEGARIYPNKMEGVTRGAEIYRNYDHRFNQLLERGRTVRTVAVDVKVEVRDGRMEMTACEERGIEVTRSVSLEGAEVARNPERVADTVRAAAAKSGGTMFTVRDVEVKFCGEVLFVSAAAVNELRRGVLDELEKRCVALVPKKDVRKENKEIKYPRRNLVMSENVVNSLSEEFYRSHGVEDIERGVDLCRDFDGVTVMRTRYCIRREMGMCLKKEGVSREGLWLVHGTDRFRLEFDCARCEMRVIRKR